MPPHDRRFDVKVYLPEHLASFLDREKHRLSMEDPDGLTYSRSDVIIALLELHLARHQLDQYREEDHRLLRGDIDELLPRPT